MQSAGTYNQGFSLSSPAPSLKPPSEVSSHSYKFLCHTSLPPSSKLPPSPTPRHYPSDQPAKQAPKWPFAPSSINPKKTPPRHKMKKDRFLASLTRTTTESPVCWTDYTLTGEHAVVRLGCGHWCCASCLRSIVEEPENQHVCPLCRNHLYYGNGWLPVPRFRELWGILEAIGGARSVARAATVPAGPEGIKILRGFLDEIEAVVEQNNKDDDEADNILAFPSSSSSSEDQEDINQPSAGPASLLPPSSVEPTTEPSPAGRRFTFPYAQFYPENLRPETPEDANDGGEDLLNLEEETQETATVTRHRAPEVHEDLVGLDLGPSKSTDGLLHEDLEGLEI
ncbi:hypothetical protein M011DRAFT_456840 [Sporormia fimetaria CBS 119925]|uniref:RING-type domain-containing protein n=1 Tax=Sporormia fimetaria CBS 119925 TaxID=1340428 RepID=A0A6A6VFL7_9PLEO|nr:hypothetical protein M011DRAFT_456840 [Sporormia fimetaria CBS 119925]